MAKTIAQRIRHFSPKTYWKELIAVLVILLAFVFFRNERKELAAIIPQLRAANLTWVSVGVGITIVYIVLQGLMYVQSFKAIGLSINLRIAIDLFLKRNLLSVFLPAVGLVLWHIQQRSCGKKFEYDANSPSRGAVWLCRTTDGLYDWCTCYIVYDLA
jgi:uncharacterized membrane protein YbhN (UPF0104 family)